MASGTRKTANDEYRANVIKKIMELFTSDDEQVMQVANNAVAFPFVNSLGGDEWIKIVVSVPDGDRKTKEPFDGYEMAEDYKRAKKESEERAKKAAEEKEKKIARDKKKREIAEKCRE